MSHFLPHLTLTRVMLSSMLAVAVLFSWWPDVDLAVSAFFWRPEIGDFAGDQSMMAVAMFEAIPVISKFIIAGLGAALLASLFFQGRGRCWQRRFAYLLVVLLLGPGLVIDVALKDHWGRARPAKIIEFGGSARFSPALQPSNQCRKNCSFVSGHASAGFFAVSLGFLGGAAARRRWTLIGLALGSLAGLGRVSQGGHFLSDVVFAFYATWFSAWLVWIIFQRLGWMPDMRQPDNRQAEAG
ncbi:MAG: phosphatase PAP2 family protein [Zoogloeaceae bacterium]|nr:phosphatase PAP2 family protein [Zoogloeaceae bacterium]